MERELYALWQGVVGHERLIKGFKCYCYIDHKNNIFSDAQLDNRRRSKKMSNWALELQQFNIDRIWIRGEANILADAPSRAPWEEKLAQFLPIPDMPVRELVIKMYQNPEALDDLVSRRRQDLTGGQEWEAQPLPAPNQGPFLDSTRDGDKTPQFGEFAGTPDFGGKVRLAQEVIQPWGAGEVLYSQGAEWPRFPACVLKEPVREDVRVGDEMNKAFPENPLPCPAKSLERVRDDRGFNFVIRFFFPVKFPGEARPKSTVWFNVNHETTEGDAEDASWEYFKEVQRRYAQQARSSVASGMGDGFGPLGTRQADGKYYHGSEDEHRFRVVRRPFVDGTHPSRALKMRSWEPREDTAAEPERFCGNHRHVEYVDGHDVYTCLGHALVGSMADEPGVKPEVKVKREVPSDTAGVGRGDRRRGDYPAGSSEPPPGAKEKRERAEREGHSIERLPVPDHGVSAADGAGDMRVAADLDASMDYYEVHPARGAVARVHVTWRSALWEPLHLPEGMKLEDLQKARITQKEFADGTQDIVQDEHGGAVGHREARVTKKTRGAWRGMTWFFLQGSQVAADHEQTASVVYFGGVGAVEEVADRPRVPEVGSGGFAVGPRHRADTARCRTKTVQRPEGGLRGEARRGVRQGPAP